jgi:hypothetical protein
MAQKRMRGEDRKFATQSPFEVHTTVENHISHWISRCHSAPNGAGGIPLHLLKAEIEEIS